MSLDICRNINESPVKRSRADIHEGSSRSRRKNAFAHRPLMQRFIPFAEEEQRRERRSSSRASLPFMPTPPTTPVPAMYPTTAVPTTLPVRVENPRPIHELNTTQLPDSEDELDLSSDEEDDARSSCEGSETSNSDSWNTAYSTVDLSHKPVLIQAMPLPPPPASSPASLPSSSSSPQLVEEEPMDISMEDCVAVEPMRLGSFQGIIPKNENVQIAFPQHGNFYDSSDADEEVARVCYGNDSDNDSLSSWCSSSSNGRVNRPGRHADSPLDNRPFLENYRVPSPYAHLQSHVPAPMPYPLPQAHVSASSPYAQPQPQPQVPTSLPYINAHPQVGEVRPPMPYVYSHPQMGEVRPPVPQAHPQLGLLPSNLPYIHPQMKPELNGNCGPLDLANQSEYNVHKAPRTPPMRINYQETQPRKMPRRPFEAPYHLESIEMSRIEYQRQQIKSRISQRLATRFISNERTEQDLYAARNPNANNHLTQKPCCCNCHGQPKLVPVPVNSFAIERFLQEAQLSAGGNSGHPTSYLLIPTNTPAYTS